MENYCPYCNSLSRAFEHNNFCSETGQHVDSDSSNAFFVSSKNLKSGKHQSRFTLRAVLNGYQYHNVDNHDCLVSSDNYLLVNKGQSYYSEIESERPTDALIVAFGDYDMSDVMTNISRSDDDVLDDELMDGVANLEFFDSTYQKDPTITAMLSHIKDLIVSEEEDPLRFEESKYHLMERLIKNHFNTIINLNRIKSIKESTRLELYKRINRAKDFMMANLGEKVNMEQISKEATLSPYHFFRTFRQIYNQTPLEYLTGERLKYSAYLLKDNNLSVSEITSVVGFESPSSFGRLFKKHFYCTPSAYRLSNSAGLA